MPDTEKPAVVLNPQPVAPPKDAVAAAFAAIAKDAKAAPEEYVKATEIPGGGE